MEERTNESHVDRMERRPMNWDSWIHEWKSKIPDRAIRQILPLLNQPRYEQRSETWFPQRDLAITSSELCAALGTSPFTPTQKFIEKKSFLSSDNFAGNFHTMHGSFWEDAALKQYESSGRRFTFDFGLLSHYSHFVSWDPKWSNETRMKKMNDLHADLPVFGVHAPLWLKGSPDGVAWDADLDQWVMIEIKCPTDDSRMHPQQIMDYYYPQVQQNMFLSGIEKTHFIQYRPPVIGNKGEMDVLVVPYDSEWMDKSCVRAKKVWEIILENRQRGNPVSVYDYCLPMAPPIRFPAVHVYQKPVRLPSLKRKLNMTEFL